MVSLPLSVKIRNRYWSHQILGASEVRFSTISAVCSIAGVANMEAHQLSAPCTFSLTVLAPSWTLCTFSSTVLAPSWVLLLLEYRHVKVLRNDFLRQHFGTAASLFSAPLLRLFLHSLVFFLLLV